MTARIVAHATALVVLLIGASGAAAAAPQGADRLHGGVA